MDEIGINVAAKTTGDQNIQKQIENLRKLSEETKTLSEFENMLAESTDKYDKNMKKANESLGQHIREMNRFNIDQRQARTQYFREERLKPMTRGEKTDLRRREVEGMWGEGESAIQQRELREQYRQWQEENGIGAGGVDMASMLTQAGISRGMGGVAQAGVGMAVRKGMGRMAGMSTLGKVGAGLGIGTAAYMGYKAIQFAGEGMDLNKRFYQDMLPFRAAMKDMGGDVDAMNTRMERMSLNIGESVFATIQLSKEWMKLGGGQMFGDVQSGAMSKTLKSAIVKGVSPNLALAYTGQMARYGTYQNPQRMMTSTLINDVIRASEAAGMGGMRRPEFINQVMSVVQNVAGTAGTVNPSIANFVSDMASMGEPFRGARGSSFINRLNAGLTGNDPSGISFLATKSLMGSGASLFDIRSQQLKGLSDPKNLKSRWSYLKNMYGGDLEMASLAFSENLGMSDQLRMIYRPGGEKDSLVELMESGRANITAETFMNTPEMMRSAYTVAMEIPGLSQLRKDERKLSIARSMAGRLGIENIEKLFTTREGFAGKSIVDMLMGGRKLTEQNIYDYQSGIQNKQFEDDLGWRSNIGSLAGDIVKMQMTEGAFGAKVLIISDTLTKLANHFMTAESPEEPHGYMGAGKRTITSSGQTMYE